jgi:DNA-binding transcriptional MerR regulator
MRVYPDNVSTTYKINDVSKRSGFSAAALRYYEQIGLLPEPPRTEAGYRLYDDRTIDRLAFIARAKQLGCSLDEISDLAIAWDGGSCGPVQDRLRAVVTDKLASARQQIVELTTLSAELQRAAGALELHRPDGPCDDQCGCVSSPPDDSPSVPQAVSLTAKPTVADVPPIACTAGTGLRGQLDAWAALLTHASGRSAIDGGVRVELDGTTPLDELIRLTAAEHDCCRFFNFAITIDTRGVALEVRGPDEASPIVQSLFGAAS